MREPFRDLWDMFHPSDSDDELEEFDDDVIVVDLDEVPQIPTIDQLPDVVDYSTRGPNDFVVAGPLAEGKGHGRKFETLADAYKWAVGKYGKSRVAVPPQDSEYRWALLIKAA